MGLFLSRLLHNIKVAGGQFLGKFLWFLFSREKGSVSRLYSASSASPALTGCSFTALIQPVPLPFCDPQFFLEGDEEQAYLTMIATRESKNTPAAGILAVDGVHLSYPVGMHLWRGKLLEEALLSPELLTNPKYFLDLEKIPFSAKKAAPEAVLLSLPWHHNFFHWMIEILPRLQLYDMNEHLQDLRLLVPQSSPKFVRESLRLAGYEDKVDFIENGLYRFPRLHILTRLAKAYDISPIAIEWLTRKIQVPKVETGKKRIYVSRADAKIRYVTNELEVQNILSDFGFETVTMSQYPLQEKIQLFQQAEAVIGSHGAAFANTAFMAPGSILIEFFQSGHFTRSFHRIACLNNLRYGFLVGQKDGWGFSVDIGQLKDLLTQMAPYL